jgi:hypothetical protein
MARRLLRLLDPTMSGGGSASDVLAPRLARLEGTTIGLLANGKANSDRLLDLVARELSSRARLVDVVRVTKEHPSLPPREDDVRRLAQAHAVVTAIGD